MSFLLTVAKSGDPEGKAHDMSKKVHASHHPMISTLQSVGSFKAITGQGDFKAKTRVALRKEKVYRPEAESSGFGSRPSFRLSEDFGTIKSDPQAYTKILRGESRKSQVKIARASHKMLRRQHHAKRPSVDGDIIAKYRPKKGKGKSKRVDRPTPSVALVYADGPRIFSRRRLYSLGFKGPKEAARALKRGEILANSLVHFGGSRGQTIFSPAGHLGFYLQTQAHPWVL